LFVTITTTTTTTTTTTAMCQQVELKQTAEKLHVQDISTTMNQTEAFKLMMREKEALIAEKYQLTDKASCHIAWLSGLRGYEYPLFLDKVDVPGMPYALCYCVNYAL